MSIKHIIIHGHFYQPPRENPWSGVIPFQPNAVPYHDWNIRITKECYGANSASRVLDPFGRITDIINNYEYFSFNFGPTLFRWLKTYFPSVHSRIIQADKLSMERNNEHGNAIAQAYSHRILPLAEKQDIRTQIRWGMEDFFYNFGRRSEGIWLPETAVNDAVIDILIEENIQFIILSPWQAEAFRIGDTSVWKMLNREPALSDKPMKILRPSGVINVFFYEHHFAGGISFDHFLRDADSLYEKILHYFENHPDSNLLNIATDGEVYGHHEPFGDMCFAALVKKIQQNPQLRLTNYGNYLSMAQPDIEVKLKCGEDSRGTSWSCTHGVSRWYKDCGCSTGGQAHWNQKWRAPLLAALEYLKTACSAVYFSQMQQLSKEDPQIIIDAFISVMIGSVTPEDFAKQYLNKEFFLFTNYQNHLQIFFKLLEGQKMAQFMFTSCGWFFSELSGIEAIQNLTTACRLIELYQPFSEENLLRKFLSVLSQAISNYSYLGTGADLFRSKVLFEKKDFDYPASIFIMHELVKPRPLPLNEYGNFKNLSFSYFKTFQSQDQTRIVGMLTVQDTTIFVKKSYSFEFIEDIKSGLSLSLIDKDSQQKRMISFLDLPKEIRDKTTDFFTHTIEEKCIKTTKRHFKDVKKALLYSRGMNTKPPKNIMFFSDIVINSMLMNLIPESGTILQSKQMHPIETLVRFASNHHLQIDKELMQKRITSIIQYAASKIRLDRITLRYDYFLRLRKIAKGLHVEPDLTQAQEDIFALITEEFQKPTQFRLQAVRYLKNLLRIGDILGIYTELYKNKLLAFLQTLE